MVVQRRRRCRRDDAGPPPQVARARPRAGPGAAATAAADAKTEQPVFGRQVRRIPEAVEILQGISRHAAERGDVIPDELPGGRGQERRTGSGR